MDKASISTMDNFTMTKYISSQLRAVPKIVQQFSLILLLYVLHSVVCYGDEKDQLKKAPVKPPQPVVQKKQSFFRNVGKYPSLLTRTKWKPSDFFELQHNLDMCQAIADENYAVIDTATKEQVNSQERYGMTILHWAFLTGDHVAFEKLLKRGADIHLKFKGDVKDDYVVFQEGSQLLFAANFQMGYGYRFFDIGLEYMSDPDCRSLLANRTLLHEYIAWSTRNSSPQTLAKITRMLELGCDPNAFDENMKTPCSYAVGFCMPEECLIMLDFGADPTLKNAKGEDLKAIVERNLKNGVPIPPNKKDLTEGYRKLAERLGANVDFDALQAAKKAKDLKDRELND